MIKVTATEGQNLLDVALRYYGDVAHIFKIDKDNPDLNLNSNIGGNTVINIDETFIGNASVSSFFKSESDEGRVNVNWSEENSGDYNDDYNNDYLN